MEPDGLTAVVPPCFGDIPPKHPRQKAAGLSLAFIHGLTPEVFCEGGIKWGFMRTVEVDIVVIAKDQLPYTRQCVESILKNTVTPFRILFIDNASSDETQTYLAEAARNCPQHGSLQVLRNKENIGWTRALNQGIRQSSAPYIIFANNDLEVFPGAIEEMISIAKSDPTIGIVNPNSNEFDLKKNDWLRTIPLRGKKMESFHAAGFLMLFKREVLQRVGNFDEIFSPGYFEEMDYSERARQAGFFCAVALGAYVFHHGSKSFLPAEKQMLWEKNEKIFYQRWGADRRFAYVANSTMLKDEKFRQVLICSLLTLIREKKAYVYLFLPFGTKKYFESLHIGFRTLELPRGLRWISLLLKISRNTAHKKIDAIYFSDKRQLAIWKKFGVRHVALEELPGIPNSPKEF